MTDETIAPSEREEIEMLLPWYVTGRLEAMDRERVSEWIARDSGLARQLALIEQERSESIALAEAIALPNGFSSQRVVQTLPSPGLVSRVLAWLDAMLEAVSPNGLRYAAAAAIFLIAAQTVGIGVMLRDSGGTGYETASGPQTGNASGTFVLVRVAPSASVADLTRVLRENEVTIASGPSADGFYRLRIGPGGLTPSEQKARVEALRGRGTLFELVLPEPNRRSTP